MATEYKYNTTISYDGRDFDGIFPNYPNEITLTNLNRQFKLTGYYKGTPLYKEIYKPFTKYKSTDLYCIEQLKKLFYIDRDITKI